MNNRASRWTENSEGVTLSNTILLSLIKFQNGRLFPSTPNTLWRRPFVKMKWNVQIEIMTRDRRAARKPSENIMDSTPTQWCALPRKMIKTNRKLLVRVFWLKNALVLSVQWQCDGSTLFSRAKVTSCHSCLNPDDLSETPKYSCKSFSTPLP